jgi:hypothetical protein
LSLLRSSQGDNRLHDISPRCDVNRGIHVRSRSVGAGFTDKLGLRPPVSSLAMPAHWAGFGRIPRSDEAHRYPGEKGFVLDERAELKVGPLVVPGALRPTNRCPLSEVSQVFQGKPSARFFSFLDYPLRNDVVGISLEPLLPAGNLLKVALGALRARLSQLTTDTLVACSRLFDALAGMCFSVGVGGEIDDTQVDTESPDRVISRWLWGIPRKRRVENAIPGNEVGLSVLVTESGSLMVADSNRNVLATVEGQKTNPLQAFEAHCALIVDKRAVWPEQWPHRLVTLVHLADFRDTAHRHLRRKRKARPHFMVDKLLKPILRSSLVLERYVRYPICRLVKTFDSKEQQTALFFGRSELDHDDQFHSRSVMLNVKKTTGSCGCL